MPIYIVAKELKIDSVKAYLYWSTGYAVECSRLNGIGRIEYQEAQFFHGKQGKFVDKHINNNIIN